MPQPHYSTRNLLRETLEYLGTHGIRTEDIRGATRAGKLCSWADFARMADRDYLAGGYGVHPSLVLIGDGWWIERGRDAGGEWWQIRRAPTLPTGGPPLQSSDIFQNG
jgi:hypothetical protein